MVGEATTDKRKRKRRDSSGDRTKHRRLDRLPQAAEALKRKLDANDVDLIKDVHSLLLKDGSHSHDSSALLPPPDGSLSHDLEKSLWKAHHCKITEFRSQMQRAAEKPKGGAAKVGKKTLKNVVAPFLDFIASSANFYSLLVSRLRLRHGLSGIVSDGWDACRRNFEETRAREFRESCYRLLLRLGDLARYKEVYGVGISKRNYSTAEDFYVQASKLCHCEGGSHGQLAVLATYTGDRVRAVYHYIRSLFAKVPSPNSRGNLLLVLAGKADATAKTGQRSSNLDNLVQLFQILLLKAEFKDLETVLDLSLKELEEAFASPERDRDRKAVLAIQIVTILISCVQDFHLGLICKSSPPRSFFHDTIAAAFKIVRMLAAINDSSATMLPALVIFMAWLAGCEEVAKAAAESDELRRIFLDTLERAESFFQALSVFSEDLFPRLEEEMAAATGHDALWEDHELQGFVLLGSSHEFMNFGFDYLSCNARQLNWKRLRRLEASLRSLAEVSVLSRDSLSNQADASPCRALPEVPDSMETEMKLDTLDDAEVLVMDTFDEAAMGGSTDLNVVLDTQLVEMIKIDRAKGKSSSGNEAADLMKDLSLLLERQLAEMKRDGCLANEFFRNRESFADVPSASFLAQQVPISVEEFELISEQQISTGADVFESKRDNFCEDLQAKVIAADGLHCRLLYNNFDGEDVLDHVKPFNK